MEQTQLKVEDVSAVEIVGGTTRIPAVKEKSPNSLEKMSAQRSMQMKQWPEGVRCSVQSFPQHLKLENFLSLMQFLSQYLWSGATIQKMLKVSMKCSVETTLLLSPKFSRS